MTPTDLANMALAHIGKTRVDSITDNTETAEYCLAFLPTIRQMFIEQSQLHKTRKEEYLAIAAGETLDSERYDYIYQVPVDMLTPIKIWNENTASSPVIYEIATHSSKTSSVILTSKEDAILIYSIDIKNLNVFNAYDIIAMSYLLASFIVMPLKVDDRVLQKMEANYQLALSIAISKDRNSQSIDVVNNARFDDIERSRLS